MSERELTAEELRAENHQLRAVVTSLASALLREAALETVIRQPPERANAERLLRQAEECFRCARIPELKSAIAQGLETAGRELMAKAVEVESARQRDRSRE